jgi:Tol biopolymer transport system component
VRPRHWAFLVLGTVALAATAWFLFRPRYAYVWEPASPLGPAVNTARDEEYEPNFTPDGKSLVFTRGKAGQNTDLYLAPIDAAGQVGPAVPIAGVNTAASDEIDGMLGADGNLYFYSDRAGGYGGYDLYAARRLPDGSFAPPANLGAQINSAYNDYDPCLSPDGKVLYFSSNRHSAGSEKDYDLFASLKTDKGWSSPRPLAALNTADNEWEPMLSPDGGTLYFTSNRPRGGEGRPTTD